MMTTKSDLPVGETDLISITIQTQIHEKNKLLYCHYCHCSMSIGTVTDICEDSV